jgi:multidrug efflux system outer membrane protein
LTSPIFSFGKRKAKYEAAIKAYDAERFQYEKKVLQAFKEVNDAVISYTSANKTVELMQNLKESSRKYVDLALFQHINGHINYIDVLDAQRSYLNAEIDYSNAIRDEYIALIELYKALGGGWKGIKENKNEK